jgi:hypothetical protein
MIVLTAMVLLATGMHQALLWLEESGSGVGAADRGASAVAGSSTRR